jgi:hypothetical protein
VYYSDVYGNSVPINYRIYDKNEGKTKKDYFQEMLKEVIDWSVKSRIVTGDSWYSGVESFKFLKNQKLGFLFGIEKNRTVSNKVEKYCLLRSLEIPDEGLITYLRAFRLIKLFRQEFTKEDSRHYMVYVPDEEALNQIITHWGIESFHRAIKQVCGICGFMVRDSQSIKTQTITRISKQRKFVWSGVAFIGSLSLGYIIYL